MVENQTSCLGIPVAVIPSLLGHSSYNVSVSDLDFGPPSCCPCGNFCQYTLKAFLEAGGCPAKDGYSVDLAGANRYTGSILDHSFLATQ